MNRNQPSSAHAARPARWWSWLMLAWCLLLALPAASAEKQLSEYDIKAAIIVNFAKFVMWPEDKLGEMEKPVTIGIYGRDPFGSVLPDTAKLQEVTGHKIVVHQLIKIEDIASCHIVYCSGTPQETDKIVTAAKGAKVVLVSDTDNFTKAGGHICLFMQEKKVRFEINQAAFERSGLKMHSQVLKLATRVTRDGKDVTK